MKISTKGRYALLIMAYLARNYNENRYITLKEISESENISLKYLERIIATLTKAKLVATLRGATGGYKLLRDPKDYTLLEIINASEGDLAPVECVEHKGTCPKINNCSSRKIWCELNNTIDSFFENKSLKDLI